MKVLVKNSHTGLYLGREQLWVADVAKAVEFRMIVNAGRKAQECGHPDVCVVLRYEDPVCELVLNVAYCE